MDNLDLTEQEVMDLYDDVVESGSSILIAKCYYSYMYSAYCSNRSGGGTVKAICCYDREPWQATYGCHHENHYCIKGS